MLTLPQWIALGTDIFGPDRDTWTFQCQHCGEVSTKRDGATFWKMEVDDPHRAGQWCPKCKRVAAPNKYPGDCFQVLGMPADFPHRTDVPEQGTMIYVIPFFADHLSGSEIRQITQKHFGEQDRSPLPVNPPRGFVSPGELALASITEEPGQSAPRPAPPPAPKAPAKKGGGGYGFKF
jgi:hypothetical protein